MARIWHAGGTYMAGKRRFGSVRKLASGRYQARYTGPDGASYRGPRTWESKDDATGWLRSEERLIELEQWTSPAERERKAEADGLTVAELIDRWLSSPALKESTVQSHRRKLEARVLRESIPGEFDSLAGEKVSEIDRQRVRLWWSQVVTCWPDQGNTNASAYKRLHTAFEFAVNELEVITVNPVKIKGAGKAPRPENRDRPLISLTEARALVEHSPTRLRVGTLLLLWSGLRIGELLELRRKDLVGLEEDGAVTVRVRRNAQRVTDEETGKQVMVSFETPKSDAGNRDIVLPSTVATALREHAEEHMADGAEALVITTSTGARMMDTNFRNRFTRAAKLAGRPDVTPHDCRRFYGTQLVTEGRVSLEEARRLMGHETLEQLFEYLRASQGYEKRAAEALEALIGAEL